MSDKLYRWVLIEIPVSVYIFQEPETSTDLKIYY